MRIPLFRVLLALLALGPRLAMPADEPPKSPSQRFTTSVQGTVPDLTGRWFVVANVGLPNSPGTIPITLLWEVTSVDGKPHLTQRWGGLPPAVKESIDAAASRQVRWEPSAQQLQEIRDGWATAKPDMPPVASVETILMGPDALTEPLKADARLKDSQFVVQLTVNMVPGTPGVTKDVMHFGVKERLPDGYAGDYAGTSIAAAPFPVAVGFTGTFRIYRLGAAPGSGLWRRVLDMFAGCGRRS